MSNIFSIFAAKYRNSTKIYSNMKKQIQEIFGYVLGGLLFVALLPALMWLASGMPALVHIGAGIRHAGVGAYRCLAGVADRLADNWRTVVERVDDCLYEAPRQRQPDGCIRT